MGKGKGTAAALLFVALVIVIAYAALRFYPNGSSLVVVRLTDPSLYPRGTGSINVTYSSLQLEISNGTGSEWVRGLGQGSADLALLANSSLVIDRVVIPSGSRVKRLRLNLSSASIGINGTLYPLLMRGGEFSAAVNGAPISNSSASLFIAVSPSIITLFTLNSTLIEMLPSLTGVVLQRAQAGAALGGVVEMNASTREAVSGGIPKIEISNASVAAYGNRSRILVTVKDYSALPVVLRQLSLLGNQTAYLDAGGIAQNQEPSIYNISSGTLLNESAYLISNVVGQLGSNATSGAAAQALSKLNLSQLSGLGGGLGSLGSGSQARIAAGRILNLSLPLVERYSAGLNSSQSSSLFRNMIGNMTNSSYAGTLAGMNLSSLRANLEGRISSGNFSNINLTGILDLLVNANRESQAGFPRLVVERQEGFGYLSFMIESNGTLALPSSPGELGAGGYGYAIRPGESATLTFDGRMLLSGGRVGVNIINGGRYSMLVAGENGTSAQLNVTAG